MLKALAAFNGVSVDNLDKAKQFYTNVLGLTLEDETMGLRFSLPGGGHLFIYHKQDHQPASFTFLNFVVDDIDRAVDDLVELGISFLHYEAMPGGQDEKGITRGINAQKGPDIAWFKDPAGNIISVLKDQ
jgi:catechol 2,3-dioxygenase-like lactoylglutathione lyase family enzyme